MTSQDLAVMTPHDQYCAECAQPLDQSPSWTRSAAGELVCAECTALIDPSFEYHQPAA